MNSYSNRAELCVSTLRRLLTALTITALTITALLCASVVATRNGESRTTMMSAEFQKLVGEYLDDMHSRHPSSAAAGGIHTWDSQLEDMSAGALSREASAIRTFQSRLEKITPVELAFSEMFDYQIIASNMKARLLELEQIKSYTRNPQVYSDLISNGLLLASMFEYASPEVRLSHIIAKEKQVPRLLDAAREHMHKPPAVFIKGGIASFKGTLEFVEKSLPQAFASVGDAKQHSEFVKATNQARRAISDYIARLERAKQESPATFAIGRANYEAKLRYDEGIELPLERLLEIANRELARTQEEFKRTAAQIDPKREMRKVWAEVQADHPHAGTLVEEARKQLDTLVRFIDQRRIVTLPAGRRPLVGPTPDFMRWSTASMWSPGPFESGDLAARYLITDVDPAWNDRQQREYLESINFPQLWSTSIHEAYPGHFVQGAYLKQVQSVVRRTWALAPASFVEGWAHYTEEMMIEEGFGDRNPKIKIGQLADALLRLCRFVVGIRLHTEDMSVDEATRFFMQNAYMGEVPSRIEAERGTFDPTYIVYTVGKLAILKMRDDYKRERGDRFSLRDFHDRLLSNGMAPLWAHRQMLMPGDKGKLIE